MQKKLFYSLLAILFLASCSTNKQLTDTQQPEPIIEVDATEFRDLDTMVVAAEKPASLKEAKDYQLPAYAPTYSS